MEIQTTWGYSVVDQLMNCPINYLRLTFTQPLSARTDVTGNKWAYATPTRPSTQPTATPATRHPVNKPATTCFPTNANGFEPAIGQKFVHSAKQQWRESAPVFDPHLQFPAQMQSLYLSYGRLDPAGSGLRNLWVCLPFTLPGQSTNGVSRTSRPK